MKTYLIAEIGINHNGKLENIYKLVDAALAARCKAAKFQFFTAKALYPRTAGRLDWRHYDEAYSYDIYEAVEGFELPPDWITSIIEYCNDSGIDFISSVFDTAGLDYLVKYGMRKIKLSSYTITNLPLVEAASEKGLPIFMSTGGASLGEVETAVNLVKRYHGDVALLHCSLQYPTSLGDCNMGVLDTFQKAFPGLTIGYSDHTMEISAAAVQSIYLGGTVIEKHITLDKKMEGPDHFFALEPDELKQLSKDISAAEKRVAIDDFSIDPMIYGSSEKKTYPHEEYLRNFAYMTLFSKRHIKTGETIQPDDIAILRAGKKKDGLHPKYFELFKNHTIIAKKDIGFEEPLNWDAFL